MGNRDVGEKLNAFEDFSEEPEDIRPVRRAATWRDVLGSLAGLLLLIGFHAAQAGRWTALDSRPPGAEQAAQLEAAWDLKAALGQGRFGRADIPPLYHLSLRPALGGANPAQGAVWVNLCYLALLAFGLWGLGRHFLGPWEGLGAAVLFTCAPQVSWLAHEVLPDLALTAWAACAYWAFAACDGFRNKLPAALFGALLGAAMLTKWTAFTFFLPMLVPAFSALNRGASGGLLGAVATAAVVAGPWYAARLPAFVSGVAGAAAAFGAPVFSGASLLAYPLLMAEGLELPLLVMGLIGAAVPSMRRKTEDSWLLPALFVSALVVWTLLPARELRLLLPGLVPLAVLAMGPFPRGVRAAACAVALLSSWNYSRGVLPHLGVFKSEKPAQEDWRLPEILKAAHGLREPGTALSSLALVADHPRLNAPGLRWELKRLGLPDMGVRGVDARTTELCEFVLVKTGELGPAEKVGALAEARKVMLDPGRWWRRGWREARRFPLPDGSEAVLFKRSSGPRGPVGEGRLRFDYYEDKAFTAEGLEVDLGRWDAARGVYPRVELKAARLVVRGLEVENLQAVLTGLNIFSADESGAEKADPLVDARLTRLDALEVAYAEVRDDALAAFLKSLDGVTSSSAKFEGGAASVSAVWKEKPVRLSLVPALSPDGSGIDAGLSSADVFGVPLPVSLLSAALKLPFAPTPARPFKIAVPSLAIQDGSLSIGR